MYLLLDECCGRSLARLSAQLGHVVQRTIEVAELGRQASDDAIFAFAARSGAILVTVNRNDFVAIAGRGLDHSGVILIPSLPRDALRPHFEAVLKVAERLMSGAPNLFVETDRTGRISSFNLP